MQRLEQLALPGEGGNSFLKKHFLKSWGEKRLYRQMRAHLWCRMTEKWSKDTQFKLFV